MKHIKIFESFNNPDPKFIGKFMADQFDEFCEVVKKWGDARGFYIRWHLYVRPDSVTKENARETWGRYIKDGSLILIEDRGRLIGTILNKEGDIVSADDHYNNKVDPKKFNPGFEKITNL